MFVMVGQRCGIEILPGSNDRHKAPCLTTEYAHRWNSYGLVHILETDNAYDVRILKIDETP